jgi:predicted transcriptional regulator
MAVTKISISLSPDALEAIDSFAADQGITRSAWIEQAAVRAARQAAVLEALREYERESGREVTAREVESARRRIYGEPGEASS